MKFQDTKAPLSSDILRPMMNKLLGDELWPLTQYSESQGDAFPNLNTHVYPELLPKLDQYDFRWAPTGPRDAGMMFAYKDGEQLGGWEQQPQQTFGQTLGELALLAGGAFGGLGLLGAGPLGGTLGGLGGAGAGATAAAGSSAFDPIAAYLTTGGVEGSIMGNALTGAGGAAGAVGAGTAANLLGNASQLGATLGGAKTLAALAGAAAGASGAGSQTTGSKMDPRMDAMLYGQGGLLPAAQQWFQQNQQPNPLMEQGVQMQKDFFGNPTYQQQYGLLRDQGLGLLGKGIAGNPFGGK